MSAKSLSSRQRRPKAAPVTISLYPDHLAWMREVVFPRTGLRPSAYIQRLISADIASRGHVLARAILADHEAAIPRHLAQEGRP